VGLFEGFFSPENICLLCLEGSVKRNQRTKAVGYYSKNIDFKDAKSLCKAQESLSISFSIQEFVFSVWFVSGIAEQILAQMSLNLVEECIIGLKGNTSI